MDTYKEFTCSIPLCTFGDIELIQKVYHHRRLLAIELRIDLFLIKIEL
jgi:hypothetical protein